MSTKWQRFEIPIPDGMDLDDSEKELLGQIYIDYIRERAKDGMGRGRKDFVGYSEEYIKSLNFKIAGKSKNDVNMTLSGDMLGALEVLEIKRNKIIVGFENGSEENAIADGNIRGTYGDSKPHKSRARDFLTATQDELEKYVYAQIPADSETRSINAAINDLAGSIGDTED